MVLMVSFRCIGQKWTIEALKKDSGELIQNGKDVSKLLNKYFLSLHTDSVDPPGEFRCMKVRIMTKTQIRLIG